MCRIMGSAELVLDRVTDPEACAELHTLIRSAEEISRLLARHRNALDE